MADVEFASAIHLLRPSLGCCRGCEHWYKFMNLLWGPWTRYTPFCLSLLGNGKVRYLSTGRWSPTRSHIIPAKLSFKVILSHLI
jgi:hypothetical protein